MDGEVVTFGLFHTGLTAVDHVTDGVQVYDHYHSGNPSWAISTLSVIFVPMTTSFVTEIMNNTIRYVRGRSDMVCWKRSLRKIFSHFPLLQPVVHFLYFLKLRAYKATMLKAQKFYMTFDPKDITDDNVSHYQKQVKKAANDYVCARKNFYGLVTEFQEMKLYEAFGENSLQAVLQFSIILQLGYITPIQIFTIASSLFSFGYSSANIFLKMKTNRRDVKEASWRETIILVLPTMFFIVIPRIMSLSLIAAYTKWNYLIFLPIMVIINTIMNLPHFRRDPGQVFLGVLTNIFSPCLVIEEGSGFYRRSGITSSILHCLSLVSVFCLVFFHAIEPCPNFATNGYTPILHCYMGQDGFTLPEGSGWMARCRAMDNDTTNLLNCSSHGIQKNLTVIWDTSKIKCVNLDVIPILKEDFPRFTVCEGVEWWLPLLICCSILFLFQIIGIFLITKFLNPIIDPIVMLKVSKSCFPANMFKPIWNEENVDFLKKETVESFLKYPCQSLLKPDDLFDISIQNDFHEIIRIALNEMENPVKIDKKLVDDAYLKGSVKTIKILLKKIKEEDNVSFDLKVLKKMLESLRKQNQGFHKAEHSINEPVFALQKYCGLSPVDQRHHWETLQLPIPSLLRIRINCSVVGLGMIDGKNQKLEL